ncbi:hypothetical protein K503DRAFT_785282 [Rhizopogon vinicolor AM-OR11-026]|uniref:Uncharacterized protein n=1 Tax=Rhizopogon vinicolor AM-OR11-026 TaxID=1314800 RepID=A0A1B7MR91_9AGAM|nr:hypothetical protein K503DRAFT_785282 [Rhizopogon vinicolor AM-OR11-026]
MSLIADLRKGSSAPVSRYFRNILDMWLKDKLFFLLAPESSGVAVNEVPDGHNLRSNGFVLGYLPYRMINWLWYNAALYADRTAQGSAALELCACRTTLLELTLKSAQYVVKGQVAFARLTYGGGLSGVVDEENRSSYRL